MVDNYHWVQDLEFINTAFHMYYNQSDEVNVTAARERNLAYTISYNLTFDPDVDVGLKQEDNRISTVRLKQGLTWLQGHMVNIFRESNISNDMQLPLYNYYSYVFPAF